MGCLCAVHLTFLFAPVLQAADRPQSFTWLSRITTTSRHASAAHPPARRACSTVSLPPQARDHVSDLGFCGSIKNTQATSSEHSQVPWLLDLVKFHSKEVGVLLLEFNTRL